MTELYQIHGFGCLNLEVYCPINLAKKTIVTIREKFEFPSVLVSCSCCGVTVHKDFFANLYSNNCRWAYKGMLLPEEPDGLETQWQEKGRSQGIAPFLNESFKKWKSLTIVAALQLPDDMPVLECFHCKTKDEPAYRFFKGKIFCEPCTVNILDKLKARAESQTLSQSGKTFLLSNSGNNTSPSPQRSSHMVSLNSNPSSPRSDLSPRPGANLDWLGTLSFLFQRKNVDPNVIESFVQMLAKRDQGIVCFLSNNQPLLLHIFDKLDVNQTDRVTIKAILTLLAEKTGTRSVKRMERTVYLKIFEAKFHDSGEGVTRDTTCVVIANNNEQIAKTPTIYQSEKPLFLEEFEFTDFQCSQMINSLTILVKEKQKQKSKVNVMSKATIMMSDIEATSSASSKGIDQWHKLYLTTEMDNLSNLLLGLKWIVESDVVQLQPVGLDVPTLIGKGHYFLRLNYENTTWSSNLTPKNKPNQKGKILWPPTEKVNFPTVRAANVRITVYKVLKPANVDMEKMHNTLYIETNSASILIGSVDITPTMLMENKDQEKWLNLKMRDRLERESGYSPRGTLDNKRQKGKDDSMISPRNDGLQSNSRIPRPLTLGRDAVISLDSRKTDSNDKRSQKGYDPSVPHVVGEIRLLIEDRVQYILPDKEYDDMFGLLIDDDLELTKRLALVSHGQEKQVAEALVRAFDLRGSSIYYINSIMDEEIESTEDQKVIFRANSVACKSVDMYMRLIGTSYLHYCLKDIINQIRDDSKKKTKQLSCELDPTRIDEKDEKKKAKVRERNYATLVNYCEAILNAVKLSFRYCPTNFRTIFTHVQAKIKSKWPNGDLPCHYTAPSALIWLRFFCAAILTPKAYGMIDETPSPTFARNLTLIGKTLQNLANLVEFGHKEEYMIIVNAWISNKKQDMKEFITRLCSLPDGREQIDDGTMNTLADPFALGREMSRVHHHLQEALPRMQAKHGADDPLMLKLKALLAHFESIV